MDDKVKVILDTDIGSDIDDAFALAYLLSEPRCELLGITTVTGEALLRTQMASALCHTGGKPGIPIYPGSDNPLIVPQKQLHATQAAALGKWEHQKDFPRGEAIEFLRKTIRANPGEVTLLAIGPMTNIGLLFSVDPEIPRLLKELVLMCGVFTYKINSGVTLLEWNALGDPHAATIMYRSPVKNIRSFGLDVTTQVRMPVDKVKEKMTAKILGPVRDFLTSWKSDSVCFHDPLAAAGIFHREVCSYRRGKVEVELVSPTLKGLTQFVPSEDGNNEVAFDVDADEFFKLYFGTILKLGTQG
jgi:inosine-uridine nucleoside N-ribohydrolase